MRRRSRLGLIAALTLAGQGAGAARDDGFAGRFVRTSDQEGFGGYSSAEIVDYRLSCTEWFRQPKAGTVPARVWVIDRRSAQA